MSAIERRDGESIYDYHRRLVYGKLIDKTLADVDYSELSEILYGQPYNSDVARRMLYGSCRTFQMLDEENYEAAPEDLAEELDAKKIELQKERQRFFDQRREYNKIVNTDGRREHLYGVLSEAAKHISEENEHYFLPHDVGELHFGENEAVLVLCDWHYGMTADNIFNHYDTDTCILRVQRIVHSAIQRIKLHGCSTLHIVVLGDLIHGACHTSARVASEELVCDQIIHASELLAQAIEKLSQYVRNTIVYITYGNHARTVQNKKDNIHRDNMERIVGWWLTQRFANSECVEIMPEEDTEFLFISAAGHDICASHGDLDSVKTSPRLLTTLFQKQYGMDIEYILLADKHHRESFDELGVTAMICGSLCGTDDYANDRRLFSTPQQLLLIVDRENGVDAEYRLKCE